MIRPSRPLELFLDPLTAASEPARRGVRSVLAAIAAAAVVGLGLVQAPASSARGGQDPAAGTAKPHEDTAAAIARIRRAVTEADRRLVALSAAVVDDPTASKALDDAVDRLRIELIQAEGRLDHAMHRRQIAELARKEFVEATFPHDATQIESELRVAQAENVRATALAKEAKTEIEKAVAELELKKSEMTLEVSEQKKLVLNRYTKEKVTRDREADLKDAHSEELRAKAELDLARGKLARAEKAAAAGRPTDSATARILALIEQALPIEEKLQAGLARSRKDGGLGESQVREMRGWSDDLAALIDEAEAVRAADALARVKPQLKKTARR